MLGHAAPPHGSGGLAARSASAAGAELVYPGWRLSPGGAVAAYVLYQAGADGSAPDRRRWARRRPAQAQALLAALQARFTRLIGVNEPADSPLIPAFEAAGFVESDRQHEMSMEL